MNFVARAKISFKFNESSLFFNRKVIIKIDPHHHHQKYPAGRVRYNRWKWGNTLYRRGSKQKRKIENRRCVVRLGRGFREYGAFVAVEIFESDVSFDVPTLPSPSSLPPHPCLFIAKHLSGFFFDFPFISPPYQRPPPSPFFPLIFQVVDGLELARKARAIS